MSELFVVNGICGGTVFFLPDVPTVLGRSAECHVQIADPWISSMHAMFEKRGKELWLVDLESRNGTWVNDQKVREAPVVTERPKPPPPVEEPPKPPEPPRAGRKGPRGPGPPREASRRRVRGRRSIGSGA